MRARILAIILLLSSVITACGDKITRTDVDTTLGISIEFPETAGTKGAVGSLPASDAENAIHSLIVWVFRSDDHTLVKSMALSEEDFPVGGGTRRYSFPVSAQFATEKPNVDVFVLANAAAINMQDALTVDSDWDTLNDAYFADSSVDPYRGFGLSHPVHSVDESLGLPMSACSKDMAIEGEDPVLHVKTVSLKRAVSRLRFIFCKMETEGNNDEVEIKRIILNERSIPFKEYVFTSGESGVVHEDTDQDRNNFDPLSYIINWPAGTSIAETDTPENYIYVNQDSQTYERMLDDAVAGNKLTDLGYTYFRESDKRLVGRIEYTVNGKERSREFNMAVAGDFARNRTWTVYGYFLSGRNLQIALNVLPWDYSTFLVDFSKQSVNVKDKFTLDFSTVDLIETSTDHYDAHLLPGIAAKGHITITTPVGGQLLLRPVGDATYFDVFMPDGSSIDPSVNNGRINIVVQRADIPGNATGKAITLSFAVKVGDREIDANTEAINWVFRFVL